MDELIAHYNKFNEDKRLTRRHGQVEYTVTMHYIHQCLASVQEQVPHPRIMDIGAGTGRYCVALAEEGYDCTAVEYVPYNLSRLRAKNSSVVSYRGDARNLKRFPDASYDVTLLFGPMYHLYTFADKQKALAEAARITKPGGFLLVAYLMNEYAVLTFGFKEGHVSECLSDGRLTSDYHCVSTPRDLYEYVRLEDINALNDSLHLQRHKILYADGAADYMRREINAMDEETFAHFIRYQLTVCERPELLGAGSHIVDILRIPQPDA